MQVIQRVIKKQSTPVVFPLPIKLKIYTENICYAVSAVSEERSARVKQIVTLWEINLPIVRHKKSESAWYQTVAEGFHYLVKYKIKLSFCLELFCPSLCYAVTLSVTSCFSLRGSALCVG